MTKEESLTIGCVDWFKLQYPDKVIIHIPNERKTSPARGRKLKRMGVYPGASDLFVPELINSPDGTWSTPGLWIELKTKGEYPKPNQRDFLVRMHSYDYAVAVAWSVDEFMTYVKNYFKYGDAKCAYVEKLRRKMIENMEAS